MGLLGSLGTCFWSLSHLPGLLILLECWDLLQHILRFFFWSSLQEPCLKTGGISLQILLECLYFVLQLESLLLVTVCSHVEWGGAHHSRGLLGLSHCWWCNCQAGGVWPGAHRAHHYTVVPLAILTPGHYASILSMLGSQTSPAKARGIDPLLSLVQWFAPKYSTEVHAALRMGSFTPEGARGLPFL